jgi:type II secretory pathway pseudopilin PulG
MQAMRERSTSSRLLGRRDIPRSTSGVGLVELMVVVTIISMIMLAAVPTYTRIQRKARASTVVNDFRVFGAVLQAHAHETGSWPVEVGVGELPRIGVGPETMSGDELKPDAWKRITPMGGQFDWENNVLYAGVRYRAAIAIFESTTPVIMDVALLQEIDIALDDGNITTGSFRADGGYPLFILEP